MQSTFGVDAPSPPYAGEKLVTACGLLVGLNAALVLLGWQFDVAALKSVVPGLVAMNPLTAACFLGCALALAFSRGRGRLARHGSRTLAIAVVLVGVSRLLAYATPLDAGLDQMLFATKLDASAVTPNRMAPNTAMLFVLVGLSLALLDVRIRQVSAAPALLLAAAGASLMAVIGYLYAAPELYELSSFIPIALNTAVAFLVLCAAIVLSRSSWNLNSILWSDTAGGVVLRRLLPVTILAPATLGWLCLMGELAGYFSTHLGVALMATANITVFFVLVWLCGAAVHRAEVGRRQAGATLQRTQQQFQGILDNTTSLIFVKDLEGRFLMANRQYERTFAGGLDTVVGKTGHDVFPKERADAFRRMDEQVAASKCVVQREELVARPDGDHHYLTVKFPLPDGSGNPYAVGAVMTDITEQKRARNLLQQTHDALETRVAERTQELLRLNQDLQAEVAQRKLAETERVRLEALMVQGQKMEAVGRLAAGVAHDFNNMLSVISTYSGLLLEDLADDNPMKADIVEVKEAGRRAAALTHQLLAFSRQQVLQLRVLDVDAVVAGVCKMLGRMLGEHVALVHVPATVPGRINADAGQLEQVVMNLAINARDAMPRGGKITLETQRVWLDEGFCASHPELRPGMHVMLAATDSGEGMDAATLARVFDPFFTSKEQGKGTGLGLATVYGIMKQFGGAVSVYSEPGCGTCFKLYFPCAEAEAALSQDVAAPALRAGTECILVAEDDAMVRRVVQRVLDHYGYRVLMASSPEEALALFMANPQVPHMLLTDMVMPGMPGTELAAKMHAIRADLPVLLMSGYTEPTMITSQMMDGGMAFVQKPLSPEMLAEKVREVLDRPRV